jgi:hypothetical protein
MKKTLVWLAILLSHSAQLSAETSLIISPSLQHFDYTEFSTTDRVLDRETGWLPGVEASLNQAITPDWSFNINTSYYQGTVDYSGETQQGVAHITDTDTGLFSIGARLNLLIHHNIKIFAGAQARQWDRDIKDNNKVSGVDETYRWREFNVGVNTAFTILQQDRLSLEASLLLIRDATIFVDLSRVNRGTTTLDLGDDTGARFKLSWSRQYNNQINYGLGLFVETWQFGRSNTRQTQNSSTITFVTEPRSETLNTSLHLNIEYIF